MKVRCAPFARMMAAKKYRRMFAKQRNNVYNKMVLQCRAPKSGAARHDADI